jgi:hypothetical protein
MTYFDDNEDRILYGRHRHHDDEDPEPTLVTCKRCGKTGLNWQHDGDGWVLHEGKFKIHHCDNSALADDFEVVA